MKTNPIYKTAGTLLEMTEHRIMNKAKMIERMHEILMEMITEHNYGIPIPLVKE